MLPGTGECHIVVLVNICCNFQNFNFQSLTMAPVKIDYFIYWRPQPIVECGPFCYRIINYCHIYVMKYRLSLLLSFKMCVFRRAKILLQPHIPFIYVVPIRVK